MAGEAQGPTWPLPKFYFSVDIPGLGENIPFQEVAGLSTEAQPIEYRAGDDRAFSAIRMPGIQKAGNVTLKKGIFAKDDRFFDWHKRITMNVIQRASVTIRLLDEGGNPTMTWTLANAWPTRMTGAELRSEANEVAIESIELAHEGLTIANS